MLSYSVAKSSMLAGTFAILLGSGLLATHSTAHAQAAPRRITVSAKRFAYTPGEITVKRGEPVVLVLTSEDVPHGIRFAELNLQADIKKNATAELAFIPAKTGDFVGHCSRFCGSGHGSMTLTLHVVD